MGAQTQTVSAGAAAVQIAGDHNTVTIVRAGAQLSLNRLHTRKTTPSTPIELLRTDMRTTTLVGRTNQLRQLADWCAMPQRIAVRCITGGAGAGKTRLAIEACEAAEAERWVAAFAPSGELARFHATQNLVHWVLPQDALIVIDYAATSLGVLKDWFAFLAPERNRQAGGKLRLLLLERQANPDEGWWAELTRRESIDRAGPADLIGKDALFALPALDMLGDKRALLAETMRLAAPLLDPPSAVREPPPLGADAGFDARLADNRIDNEPLYLMMAGVHAARHGAPAALALDRVELAGTMAAIETARLEKFARARGFTDDGKLLKHLAACVTLRNGCSPTELTNLAKQEMAALGLPAPFDARAVAERLCDCLPVVSDAVEPVRPDLIGEAFLLPIISGGRFRSQDERHGIVLRVYQGARAGTVDALIRCAQDLAGGRADHAAVQWLRAIVEASDNTVELMRIADFLPHSTLSLRELALDVHGRIATVLRAVEDQQPDVSTPDLAMSLNNLANRLGALGRREEALAAAEEAVRLQRTLAATRPDAFTPDLAMSLNNLADRLSALGRREEALAAAEEAVRLQRTLAATRPDAFTPDLAGSLNNLASFLSDLGRREEALAAAEEAVRLYRTLAATRPDAFTPDLAMSLNNLASFLSALGQREQALAAAEEAVRLRRTLAATRPDAFTPDLAGSLNNLANSLSDLGQREQALAAAEEAVRLRRSLAATRPDAFTPDLAMSLNNLASFLSDLGQREQALAAAEEAVRLRRSLAATRPDAFTPDLAMSLNNLASFLSDLGQREQALAAAEEAVRLQRTLAATRPDAFTPDLAMSLNNLADRLSALGRREEALAAAEEAVRLYRTLAATRPDAFTPDLAMSLNNLASFLSDLGQREQALAAAEEAVRLRRSLAATRPEAFTPDLAMSLNNLANSLSDLGQREQALAPAEEAVRLRRSLAATRPDAFTPDLARSLSVLGYMLESLDRIPGAIPLDEEAVRLLRPYFLQQPAAFSEAITAYARDYIRRCELAGKEPDIELLEPIINALSGGHTDEH